MKGVVQTMGWWRILGGLSLAFDGVRVPRLGRIVGCGRNIMGCVEAIGGNDRRLQRG